MALRGWFGLRRTDMAKPLCILRLKTAIFALPQRRESAILAFKNGAQRSRQAAIANACTLPIIMTSP